MKNESQRVLGRILAQTLPEADVEMMDAAGGNIPNPGTASQVWTGHSAPGSSQTWHESDGFNFDGAWAKQTR